MSFNLKNYKHIFFIGIGGVSMSALAQIVNSWGVKVSGSDLVKSDVTKKLKKLGIKIYFKHCAKNVKGSSLVVFSGAISSDNPEYVFAKQNNIKTIERAELLYYISREFDRVIAISGAHGKTTLTALIGYIFMVAGYNPTIHIGANFGYINGNVLLGENKYFITEACEFRDSFLTLKPTTSVITNIEAEHLDYFKNFENVKSSFNKFKQNTTGSCFVCGKYLNSIKNQNKILSYGFNLKNNIYAKNVVLGQDHKYYFDCFYNKSFVGTFKLNIYGKHNVENALCAIGVAMEYGVDYKAIYLALKTFNNASRRFEILGKYKENFVIHDYAHHPTEIAKTIKTCKEVFNKKIVCVFQPHTYSRTRTLINSFLKCFSGVNVLYVLNTYSAREEYDYFGSASFLKRAIQNNNANFLVKGAFNKKQFFKQIKEEKLEDSVLLFLGAGDIENLARKIIKK